MSSLAGESTHYIRIAGIKLLNRERRTAACISNIQQKEHQPRNGNGTTYLCMYVCMYLCTYARINSGRLVLILLDRLCRYLSIHMARGGVRQRLDIPQDESAPSHDNAAAPIHN